MATQQLRMSTVIEKEAIKVLTEEGIEIGSTMMAPKKDVGQNCGGGRAVLQTNVYGLLMKAIPVERYDVGINGYTRSGRVVEMVKKVSGDALYVDRRAYCRDIMTAFKAQYPDVLKLSVGNCIYYDLQSILYSIMPLDISSSGCNFPVTIDSLSVYFERVEVQFKTVAGQVITLGDLSAASSDAGYLDQSLEQFLNIATSQHMMFNKEEMVTFSSSRGYMLNPVAYGFKYEDCPVFNDNGSYLAVGVQKGVRYVEGPRAGARNVALVVEVKKTPFHSVEPVMDKASHFVDDVTNCQNGQTERLTYQFKGLQMETTYGRTQKFMVTGVCPESAQTKRIMIGEGNEAHEISIQQYFQDKYNIVLQHPTTPLLEARGRNGQTNYFPMELCIVSDNQRVRPHQQTPKQTQEMIKKCAVPPTILRDQGQLVTNSLNLKTNEFLNAAKIRFISEPLNVNARILAPPCLQYGGEKVAQVRTDNFGWMGRSYLIPVEVRVWAAFAFVGGTRDSISERDFSKFIERYLAEARKSGINIPDPMDIRFSDSNPENLKEEIRLAAQNEVEFVLIAHPDAADDMHAAMKLCERNFSVITQGVKIGTVRSVLTKGQILTVQNIVNKTNIKLGGLNYSLTFNDEMSKEILGTDTLFIGVGMSHFVGMEKDGNGNGNRNGNTSGSGSDNGNGSSSENTDIIDKPPSVVGYSANIGSHNFEFIGDFMYQEMRRDEKVNLIRHVVTNCVKKYREKQRKDPRRVIIYRNGCSDGQFANILKYEVPLIKSSLSSTACDAKVTVLVCNKLQNVRFFDTSADPRAKPTEQNIRPGTVVDSCVVHPCYREFFLNSHRALQGTARTVKYTVLYDDNDLSMDQMEGISYHLCYGHEIVFSPTSLPTPVYVAMLYAERGLMLYRRYKATSSDDEPRRYTELTDRLGYENVVFLANRRINA